MIIRCAKAVLPDRVIERAAVAIDDSSGLIEQVGPLGQVRSPRAGETVLDEGDAIVAPGFIDLHVHGAWGADFMDATRRDFETVCAYHALHGTTSLLATSTSAPTEAILAMLEVAADAMSSGTTGSRVLGVHLEGPWLNPAMKGCHLESQVRPPDEAERRAVMRHASTIRRVTLSPEIEGCMEFTRELARAGIVVSVGHSTMTYEEMMAAIEAGVRFVTHIFCAMSTTVRKGPWRHPGVLETALVDDRLTAEMIADGKHLPVCLMKLAYKCKGSDRLCLASDAMRGAGMPEGGRYTFGPRDGTETIVADGVAMLPDMTAFASSITPLDAMVRNMVEMVGLPLEEAARMASLTPARAIGIADRKGSLEAGKDADLCIMDERLAVRKTVVRGKLLDKAQLWSHAPADALRPGA